jgi:hypothetical protein
MTFGRFVTGPEAGERLARIRSLRAFPQMFCHGSSDFIELLRQAESDPTALQAAYEAIDRLPARQMRKMLCSYAELIRKDVSQ